MCRSILLELFVVLTAIFMVGGTICILWLGAAALDLFLKVFIPALLIICVLAIIGFLIDLF